MALLSIIVAPDPRLKVKSAPVKAVDDGLRKLMDDMLETMYEAPGIGLSAVQVGVHKQLIVIDVSDREAPKAPLHLVNPRIIAASVERGLYEEGCLSLPEMYAEVERSNAVTVGYLDYDGNERRLDAEGLLATCIQHEVDHLEGILFVDHISAIRRSMILRKLQQARLLKATAS